MTTQELQGIVERIVKERIEEIVGRVRMSSVEISRTTAGKPGYGVKVYDADPIKAANKAREIEQRLAEEYGMISKASQTSLFEQNGTPAPEPAESASQDAPAPSQAPEGGGNDSWD